jgi:hypothetical protein
MIFFNNIIIRWLKVTANKKPKYNDIVLIVNMSHILYHLDKINILTIKELTSKAF